MGLLERLNGKWDETYFADIRDENNDVMKTISEMIDAADAVVIGAGSGLSTAAGLTYGEKRFEDHFSDFIQKYGMTDMYSAGFYPFQSQEEKWAYWSKHIYYNRYDIAPLNAYTDLFNLVKEKEYFVLTTNVDAQFVNAGFDKQRIFATQGDYGKLQCAHACHKKLYDNEEMVRKMLTSQENCKIPTALVPKCPVCGGEMEVNLRCDQYFVEDDTWDEANERYHAFLKEHGVVWHQQTQFGKFMTAQVLLADPANSVDWNVPYANMVGADTHISTEKLECVSPLATLTGDEKEMHLVIDVENASAEMVLRPREMVLYNGTTGLLNFLSAMDNHQFSFPNMDVEGTFTINGKTHQIKNTTAWFDRQCGFADTSSQLTEGKGMNRLSWLWIGFPMGENRNSAVSLWDSFAADITLDLEILPGDPEFYHPENGLSGFEALCKITGTHKGEAVDRYGFLEIIGDVCGEV